MHGRVSESTCVFVCSYCLWHHTTFVVPYSYSFTYHQYCVLYIVSTTKYTTGNSGNCKESVILVATEYLSREFCTLRSPFLPYQWTYKGALHFPQVGYELPTETFYLYHTKYVGLGVLWIMSFHRLKSTLCVMERSI